MRCLNDVDPLLQVERQQQRLKLELISPAVVRGQEMVGGYSRGSGGTIFLLVLENPPESFTFDHHFA